MRFERLLIYHDYILLLTENAFKLQISIYLLVNLYSLRAYLRIILEHMDRLLPNTLNLFIIREHVYLRIV